MTKYPARYTVEDVYRIRSTASVKINDKYVTARPLGFQSFWVRIAYAWLVFTGRADALVWPEGQ